RILDEQARLLKQFSMQPNESVQFGNDLKAGLYFLVATQGKESKTSRLVKF
ncbi:MAG: T9SS type A sorting domain-containing protein, partial [Proteobacteria bacterium]